MERQGLRIILEGPDGSGKTTLREHLVSQFHNLEVIRNERNDTQDFLTWWPEQLDREKGPMVPLHDRFFYSELVYGPVIRGHVRATPELVRNVSWFLRSWSFLIYCRPPADVIRREVHREDQMEGVKTKLDRLIEEYDLLMEAESDWYQNRFIRYDWTVKGALHNVTAAVENYLGESS